MEDHRTVYKFHEHFEEAQTIVPPARIVGLFLQGSQNYGLDTEASDVDTKLVITPTIRDTALCANPTSYTHVRKNDEHIDVKDIRLMITCYRKQNINFIETLFTPWFVVTPFYATQWYRLVQEREAIAHYNPYAAAYTMLGVARTKREQLTHDFPTRHALIEKFGYDPKQLLHLLRIEEFFDKYSRNYPYANCLRTDLRDYLLEIKSGVLPLDKAIACADAALARLEAAVAAFTKRTPPTHDKHIEELFQDVEIEIIKASFKKELCPYDD